METDDIFFKSISNMVYFKVSLVTEDKKFVSDQPCIRSNGPKFTKLLGPHDELGAFVSQNTKVLITTDILSRGTDFDTKKLNIVNFDLPVNKFGEADFETYIHRIGRTGRFG